MKIALDYDGTITRDPATWEEVANLLHRWGHEVVIVTNRGPGWADDSRFPEAEVRELAEMWDVPLVLCGPRPKAECVPDADVWIDDQPAWVHGGPWLETEHLPRPAEMY